MGRRWGKRTKAGSGYAWLGWLVVVLFVFSPITTCSSTSEQDAGSAQEETQGAQAGEGAEGQNQAETSSEDTGADTTRAAEAVDAEKAKTGEDGDAAARETEPETEEQQQAAGAGTASSSLVVRFLDVGQGDAALVSCDGHWMLVDGGPAKASSKIYSILKTLDVGTLDVIVATHPDADHIGGISGALNYAGCTTCYSPVTENETKTFNNMKKYLDERGCALSVPQIPTSFALGAAQVTLVAPTASFGDDNNDSIVCRIVYGDTSFLLMGDAETEEEEALVRSGQDIRANVLKVGHHGSKNASSAKLLSAVQPEEAVISVGKNSYGHPTQEVLERLESRGVNVRRTDRDGSIIATSDGSSISFENVDRVEK